MYTLNQARLKDIFRVIGLKLILNQIRRTYFSSIGVKQKCLTNEVNQKYKIQKLIFTKRSVDTAAFGKPI